MRRRRFNRGERIALYLAAGGRCAGCGITLPAGWHADHVDPFARGGLTDVVNGQALCPECNLAKGARVKEASVAPVVRLRPWQNEAIQAYRVLDRRDFLCVATPGAGKTVFVCVLAWQLLDEARARRVLVVVPTDHLRKQWAIKAAEFGIQLDYRFENQAERLAGDFDGLVVTYQQVASAPFLFRTMVGGDWLVVFDEVHHAGEGQSWAAALKTAFEHAGRRVAVTGTPFRTDNNQIPFVRYDRDGHSQDDFGYGYREALRDGVCRPVYFPTYGGDVRWWTERFGEVTANFREDLSDDKAKQRLRAALSTSSGWMPAVLREADARLVDIREAEYPEAGGLVIATDQQHARAIAEILERTTGERPLVAVSDDPEPSAVIDRFARGDPDLTGAPYQRVPRWLVAVKMVSEGVDIPRLCVGVYATQTVTELFFRQAVGRFVRARGDGLAAWMFVPRDPTLVAHMERITEEREHVVAEAENDEETERSRQRRMELGTRKLFTPISAIAIPEELIYDEERYSQEELREARAFLLASDMEGMSVELAVRWLRKAKTFYGYVNEGVVPTAGVPKPLVDEKKVEREAVKKLVNRFCGLTGVAYRDVHAALNRRTGSKMAQATLDDLIERQAIMKGLLEYVAVVEPGEYDTDAWLRVVRDER